MNQFSKPKDFDEHENLEVFINKTLKLAEEMNLTVNEIKLAFKLGTDAIEHSRINYTNVQVLRFQSNYRIEVPRISKKDGGEK